MPTPSKSSPCVGIRTCSDYSSFGVELDGRTVSGGYRFGFQGSEKDNEFKGDGNSYTTEFRQYDPRIGRWLSVDPLMAKFPWQSPYVAFDNNPIYYNDPRGLAAQDGDDPKSHKVKQGDTYSSLSKKYNVSVDNLRKWNGYKDKSIPVGADLIVSDPTKKANEPSAENISDYNQETDYYKTNHLTPSLRTLMLGTNVLVSNIAKNKFDTEISCDMSESEKQDFMKMGGYATASVLLMEFVTGTGAETRRFGIENNLTKYLKNSNIRDNAYQIWKSLPEDKRANGVYMPYSPDKGGDPTANGLIGHFLGGTTWYFNQTGKNLQIKVVNQFNIESFNLFGRLENIVTGNYTGIKEISRKSPNSNIIIPLGTTNQIFNWKE